MNTLNSNMLARTDNKTGKQNYAVAHQYCLTTDFIFQNDTVKIRE